MHYQALWPLLPLFCQQLTTGYTTVADADA